MSSGQTPRPITTTAPSTTTTPPVTNTAVTSTQASAASSAPATPANRTPATTPANRTPSTTPANRTPSTTPVNRTPATTPVNSSPPNTQVQLTQVHPIPSGQPIPTAAQSTSSTPLIGENVNELIIITENANYDKLLKEVGNKYLLVEFYAPWCGACMLINKKLVELAASYSGKMIIAKVNIDDCEQIAVDNNVSMMPSFMLLKDGQVLEKFAGSSEEKLISVIQKYVGEPTNVGNDTTTTNNEAQQRIPIESTAQVPQASPLAPT